MTAADPTRAALERLVIMASKELDILDIWVHTREQWNNAIAAARAALAALPPDGPAVPEGREPAAVAGEPSDEELLQLMPEQFRADLGTVSRMAAHGAGTGVTPGLFRVSLNTGALDYARAVLARWGRPAPAPAGEVGRWDAELEEHLAVEWPSLTMAVSPPAPEPEVVGPTMQLPEQAPDEHPPSNLDRREIAAWYHGHGCGWQAARAALAALPPDGPAVPEGREPAAVAGEPSDEELDAMERQCYFATEVCNDSGCEYLFEHRRFARAVLARWGTPNLAEIRSSLGDAPAPPAPPAPTAKEVGRLAAWLRNQALAFQQNGDSHHYAYRATRAADLLEMCFSAKLAHDGSGNNE